jgi:hypothetical protein
MGEEEPEREEGAEGRRGRPRKSWCVIFFGGTIFLPQEGLGNGDGGSEGDGDSTGMVAGRAGRSSRAGAEEAAAEEEEDQTELTLGVHLLVGEFERPRLS